jgi:hypothetical protein
MSEALHDATLDVEAARFSLQPFTWIESDALETTDKQ